MGKTCKCDIWGTIGCVAGFCACCFSASPGGIWYIKLISAGASAGVGVGMGLGEWGWGSAGGARWGRGQGVGIGGVSGKVMAGVDQTNMGV